MNRHLFRILIILAALTAAPLGGVLAHGAAVIAVQPDVVAAGGEITVTGTEMEAGETFAITLEGTATSITLGTATATASGAGETSMSSDTQMKATPEVEPQATVESVTTPSSEAAEGSFRVTFTISREIAPGSYIIKATPEDGDTAEADLTVTAPSDQASAGPVTIQEPTGEEHQLDRSKPTGEIVGIAVVVIMSGGLGLWLARKR
jgi:hypothetical protein